MTQTDLHWIREGNISFAGRHLLLDLWDVRPDHLSSTTFAEDVLKMAAREMGAHVLLSKFHKFGDGGGVTGVLVLAESHISAHTWPERGFAAFDVFVCGVCNPSIALDVILRYFGGRPEATIQRRGLTAAPAAPSPNGRAP